MIVVKEVTENEIADLKFQKYSECQQKPRTFSVTLQLPQYFSEPHIWKTLYCGNLAGHHVPFSFSEIKMYSYMKG